MAESQIRPAEEFRDEFTLDSWRRRTVLSPFPEGAFDDWQEQNLVEFHRRRDGGRSDQPIPTKQLCRRITAYWLNQLWPIPGHDNGPGAGRGRPN